MADQNQIELLTKEVTRRLLAMNHGESSASGAGDAMVISGAIISTVQLAVIGDGVKTIAVDEKAIVTPAAVDWLNDQEIEICRNKYNSQPESDQGNNGRAGHWSVMVVDQHRQHVSGWVSKIGTELKFDCIVKASEKCGDLVAHGGSVALITGEPEIALIVVNRQQALRGILGQPNGDLRRSMETTRANVIVIDARGQAGKGLLGQIKQTARNSKPVPAWL